jgi:hypothetical protein
VETSEKRLKLKKNNRKTSVCSSISIEDFFFSSETPDFRVFLSNFSTRGES